VVGGDFSFYAVQEQKFWDRLFNSASSTLRFVLKMPEDFTVKRYSSSSRYGEKAGQENPTFLDAGAFMGQFLSPLEPYRKRVPALVFEFGTFAQSVYPQPDPFFRDLDRFLADVPGTFRYAVEIRNEEFLKPEYFHMLGEHQVAHVFNAWTRMPPRAKQIQDPLAFSADFAVVRALLRVGRSYENPLNAFASYTAVKEVNQHGREAMAELILRSREKRRSMYMLVNNRFKGFAPGTSNAVVDLVEEEFGETDPTSG
jgi:uncharacterized protein YecE (DUF72 family)